MNFIRLARIWTVQRSFWNHVLAALLLVAVLSSCGGSAKKNQILERADRFFKTGEYEKAKIEYMNVLRLSFKEPKAIERLGLIWVAEGAPLRAYPYLLQTRDLEPENLESRTKLAAVLASLGELAEARKEALAVLQQSPGNEEALLVLADCTRSDEEADEVRDQLRKTPEGNEVGYHLAWASLASRTGDFAYLKSELEQALAANPKSARAHLMMAAYWSSQESPDNAEREYRMAMGLSAPGSDACLEYAHFERESGALDKAKAILKETIKFAPSYLAARSLLAEIAFQEGKLEESLNLIESVLDVDFANLDALILQAQVRLAMGDAARAAESLESLDTTYPNVPFIKYQLARAYAQNNKLPQAITALEEALAGKPDYPEAILLHAEIELRLNNPNLVIPAMLGLLKKERRSRPAQLLLAEAYRLSGRLDDAAAVIREQITDSPQVPDGYLRLGIILAQEQKSDEARQAFGKALELAPDDLTAFDRLIDLEIRTNNPGLALKEVARQLDKTPEAASAHLAQGKVFAAQDDWEKAEPALVKTIQLDPKRSEAYELLVFGYVARGSIAQAVQRLHDLLAKNPNDERALMTLGLIYDKQQNFVKARDAYEKLLAINPGFTSALINLSYLYAEKLNDPGKAYELAQKARFLEPVNPTIADALGWALYKQGNYQDALNLIRDCARGVGNDSKVQFHLGMASYMMGQLDESRAAFRKAVAAPVDSPSKEEARRWLAYIEDDSGAPKQLSMQQLATLVEQRPADVVARLRLGSLYEKQNEPGKAAAQFEAAISANPNLSEAYLKLALLYSGPLHDRQKALELAKTGRELDSGSPRASAVLGKVALEAGNSIWAYNLLQDSARQLPKDSRVLADFAWAAYSLGKISEARQIMQRALDAAQAPGLAEEQKIFLTMTSTERPDPSTGQQIKTMLEHDPEYVPALMARAATQLRQGQTDGAVEVYRQVLRRFPDFAPAQKQLALLFIENPAQTDEAYDLAVKAHNTLPDDSTLERILGELSYRKNQFAYALQLLEHSARATPLDAKSLYYLGMAHYQMQQQAQSRGALERSLAAGLPEPLASEARRALATLDKGKS